MDKPVNNKRTDNDDIVISGYKIELTLNDPKLSIKAINQFEGEYFNEDITKETIFSIFSNTILKSKIEGLLKEKTNVNLSLIKDILQLVLKVDFWGEKVDISFDLKKNKNKDFSNDFSILYKQKYEGDEERINNLANELDNSKNSRNPSSIGKQTDTNTNSNFNDLDEITKYVSYQCPNCGKIPKIIFINDNKININKFLDSLNNHFIKTEKFIPNYCENCQKERFYCDKCAINLCEDCKKKNKLIMWENKINNLINSEIKSYKKNSKNKTEIIKETKEDYIDFSNKTDNEKFDKGEDLLIGMKNKYSPYSPECNQLINIILHNSRFYLEHNHLENLENIYNFKRNNIDYVDKNKFIIEYKGKGEKEGINLFGSEFISNNKDKIKTFINQKEYDIEKGKYKTEDEKIIVTIVEKEKGKIENMSYLFSECTNIISLIDGE